MDFQYDKVPRWILIVGAVGTPIAGILAGLPAMAGFALGTLGSWWNYKHLTRVVKALGKAAVEQTSPAIGASILGMFLRLFIVAAGVLAILKYSKISLIGLLVGLFASCIAIGLEIVYELVWSTKSG